MLIAVHGSTVAVVFFSRRFSPGGRSLHSKSLPFLKSLHFFKSQFPVDCVDNLNSPIWRNLYVSPMEIIEKHEFVVDLPDSRCAAHLCDDL